MSAATSDVSAGVAYLMDLYGLSQSEADERISLEEEVSAFATQLKSSNPDGFGGIWIEHSPVYKIVVAVKDNTDAQALRKMVSPQMRRYLQTKKVKFSEAEIEVRIDRVIQALLPLNINYVSYYEHKNDSLVIETSLDSGVGLIRQALPQDLMSFVQIKKGSVPSQMQATGMQSGDGVYGGWSFSDSTADASRYVCSFAFNAKDNLNRPIILTAAHCANNPRIYYQRSGVPHWVSLTFEKEWIGPGTKYDYQFHRTDGLNNGAWVWFDNGPGKIDFKGFRPSDDHTLDSSKNIIASQSAEGYYAVKGTWGYYDQKVGQVLCKSGRSTGLTCGQITHGYYTFNGIKGWIETGLSSAFIYAVSGDSGGAVFTEPTTAGGIKAAGIVTAATIHDPTRNAKGEVNFSGDERPCLPFMEGNSSYPDVGPDCKMIHMPIDYVDDQQLITIVTQ